MSEKDLRKQKDMTIGRALTGFFAPILVLILLIAMGADVTIAALAALFVMIGFCFYMGFGWSEVDIILWNENYYSQIVFTNLFYFTGFYGSMCRHQLGID